MDSYQLFHLSVDRVQLELQLWKKLLLFSLFPVFGGHPFGRALHHLRRLRTDVFDQNQRRQQTLNVRHFKLKSWFISFHSNIFQSFVSEFWVCYVYVGFQVANLVVPHSFHRFELEVRETGKAIFRFCFIMRLRQTAWNCSLYAITLTKPAFDLNTVY